MASFINHKRKQFYIHIPKNGGGTVSAILRQQADWEEIIYTDYPVTLLLNEGSVHRIDNIGYGEYLTKYEGFAMSRNPWDKLFSAWKWTNTSNSANHFRKIVKNPPTNIDWLWHGEISQLSHIKNKAEHIVVTNFFKFEDYYNSLSKMFKQMGIDISKLNMTHIHKTRVLGNYKSFYDVPSIKIVNDKYKEDIEYFKYKF